MGASGPLLAQNMALSREQLAIQALQSHHRVFHLNCKKGWCPFVKILKSSKMDKNALTKGHFSAILLKSSDLDETKSMGIFEGVEFVSVVKIDVGSFLGDLDIIFG